MNKIYFIGDSLSATYDITSYPQFGFGQMLKCFIHKEYEIINLAYPGCSTKSFIDQKRFEPVIDNISQGDYLFITFGNNDQKESDPKRFTDLVTYINNINYFVKTALNNKATPILITPPVRRNFENSKIKLSHGGYPKAMVEYAKKNKISYVDLQEITKNLYNELGEEKTKEFHLIYFPNEYSRYPDGVNDTSHFNMKGALKMASIIASNLYEEYPNLFIDPKLYQSI